MCVYVCMYVWSLMHNVYVKNCMIVVGQCVDKTPFLDLLLRFGFVLKGSVRAIGRFGRSLILRKQVPKIMLINVDMG